jgi:hypothetical protein
VGPPPSAIHGGGRLSRHPCRSAHYAPPAFSLHPSRDLWCLDFRALRSKIKSERSSGSFPRSLWETPEVTTAARRWIIEQMSHQTHRLAAVAQLRRLPQGLVSSFEISARHTTLEQSSGGDLLIVPTLRVGIPSRTLCVQNDAQRHALRYHAERGNDRAGRRYHRRHQLRLWQAERRRRSVGTPPTGIHAAQPTPRHLRSACTQVALGVVWTVAYLEAKSKANVALEVFRDPCGRRRRSRRQRGGGSGGSSAH